MIPKTQAQDSDAAAAAETLMQANNRPQDSFYDVAGQAAQKLGFSGGSTLYGGNKDASGSSPGQGKDGPAGESDRKDL